MNVRTSRVPSLSSIRQCRKAKSKGSSFFSEKSTLNIAFGLVSVILPPALRPVPWGQSITHIGVPSAPLSLPSPQSLMLSVMLGELSIE
jgi:hypothetical protein